jgi:hypothetical protein
VSEKWKKETICPHCYILIGTICTHLIIVRPHRRILGSCLLWVAGFIARHEEARMQVSKTGEMRDRKMDMAIVRMTARI